MCVCQQFPKENRRLLAEGELLANSRRNATGRRGEGADAGSRSSHSSIDEGSWRHRRQQAAQMCEDCGEEERTSIDRLPDRRAKSRWCRLRPTSARYHSVRGELRLQLY